jgi:RNase H-fold protein (predicted Holliday junction resolvase)
MDVGSKTTGIAIGSLETSSYYMVNLKTNQRNRIYIAIKQILSEWEVKCIVIGNAGKQHLTHQTKTFIENTKLYIKIPLTIINENYTTHKMKSDSTSATATLKSVFGIVNPHHQL